MALQWRGAPFIEKFFIIYFAITFFGGIFVFLAFSPKEFGKVVQGRAVAYDKQNMVVTIIADKNNNPKKPDYSLLPPIQFKLPEKDYMRGPTPDVGKRLKIDPDKGIIRIYDDATQSILDIPIKVVERKTGIRKDDPLVKDKKFPIINKEKNTVTIYSARLRELLTFEVPAEHINRPSETWLAGDEVRIYYKEPGKAHKFMNVTKTDIYKK